MEIPEQAISEFQQLYSAYFGIELSFEEAKERAEDFLGYFRLIITPDKEQDD